MSRMEIMDVLRKYKSEKAAEYGISAIGIFGSVAREEARDDSDVDIVVRMEKPDLFYLVHIKDDLEHALHKKIDIVHYRASMNAFLKKRIDRDAVYA